jgi:prephenate dehydratase
MTFSVRAIEYFYMRVEDEPGRAYDLLARLASEDINLLAFSAVPFGPNHVELTIFPDRSDDFRRVALPKPPDIQDAPPRSQ